MLLHNPLFLFAFLLLCNLVYGVVLASFLANDRDEILALSMPLSFATFAFSTLPALYLEIDFFPISQLLTLAGLITFLIQAIRTGRIGLVLSRLKSLLHAGKNSSVIVLGYFFILLHLFSQQALVPFYGLGSLPGDWFGHYRITHEFLTHSIEAIPMRLPLYQLLQGFFLSTLNPVPSFGHDFYQFQIVQLLVGLSIFPVVHLLFKRMFDDRVSSALTFAAALLPYVVIQSLFTWPKMLASTFSLLGFYYYLDLRIAPFNKKALWLCSLFTGLSVLSHWLGLIYFACIFADFVWDNFRAVRVAATSKQGILLNPIRLVAIVFLILAPIYLWGFLRFGFTETLLANWSIVEKPEYSILQSILIRGMNFLTTFFLPLSILIGFFRELPQLGLTKLGWIDLAARSFSWHLGSILGNLSLTVTILLLLKLWQSLKSVGKQKLRSLLEAIRSGLNRLGDAGTPFAVYSFGGIGLLILVQSYPHTYGVSLSGLLPSVLLMFGWILSGFFANGKRSYLVLFLFIESMLFIWVWQGMLHYLDANYVVQPKATDPALLLLNEVIRYKRELNLTFLTNAVGMNSGFIIAAAIVSEIGLFILLLYSSTSRNFFRRLRPSKPENPVPPNPS